MTSKAIWRLRQFGRKLWVRAGIVSLAAVAVALTTFFVAPYLPFEIQATIGAEGVDRVLAIIASSMLAVTTFSLSTMIGAYGAATSNATPRATKLMIEDSTTNNVLATFIGSFLYSLAAIIALSAGAYGERGRIVLFVVTMLIVLLIVGTLLRWIDYLMRLGRVGETSQRVEDAAQEAMEARRQEPHLGGVPLDPSRQAIPSAAWPVFPDAIGYVEHVDAAALDRLAGRNDARVFVVALPGTFIDGGQPLAMVDGVAEEALADDVRDTFSVGPERSFEQDPRFGLIVLSEIASRALSPAVNDPGTAVDIIGRAVRVLSIWNDADRTIEPNYARVHVSALELGDLFDDFFLPVARDGAKMAEVQTRLQKALAALARLPDPRFAREARRVSALALAHAQAGLALEHELRPVEAAAALVGAIPAAR